MLAKVISCAVVGLQGYIVQVEVDISPGLQDEAVQEARERLQNISPTEWLWKLLPLPQSQV